jgi:hypothetical protein
VDDIFATVWIWLSESREVKRWQISAIVRIKRSLLRPVDRSDDLVDQLIN